MTQAVLADMRVGAEVGPLTLPRISRTTLALFAGASGDHNPIHIDIDFAKAAGFDDVFAHGMLSMGYLGRLLIGWAPQRCIRSYSVRFVAMTPVHAEITCRGRVTAIDGGLATIELTVARADGVTTLVGEAVVEVHREADLDRITREG